MPNITPIDPTRAPVWIDRINPTLEELDILTEQYHFHELDREAIIEENQYARIDSYDDYLFLVLHFPKYEMATERYISNEFNIFLSRDYLITFRYYQTGGVYKKFREYEEKTIQ